MGLIEIFKTFNTNLDNFDSDAVCSNQSSNPQSTTAQLPLAPPVVQLPETPESEHLHSHSNHNPHPNSHQNHPNHQVYTISDSHLQNNINRQMSPPTLVTIGPESHSYPSSSSSSSSSLSPSPSSSRSPSPTHHHHHHNHLHPHHHNQSPLASPSPSIHSESSSLSLASATSTFAPSPIVITNRRLLDCWHRLERVPFIGLLFALASVLFWSSNGLFFKLNKQIHVLETLTISSFLVCLIFLCIILLFYDRNYDRDQSDHSAGKGCSSSRWTIIFGIPGERTNLALRSTLGTISLACFYTAYSYIPLGDATTIRFTSPVFIAIFAHFMVAEPFGILQVINCCTTLVGVMLIGRPSFLFPSRTPIGIASATNLTTSVISRNHSQPFVATGNRSMPDGSAQHTFSNIVDYFSSADHLTIISSTVSSLDPNQTLNFGEFSGVVSATAAVAATVPAGAIPTTNVLLGVMLALFSAITISISMIYMKKMKQTPAPLVIFWFSLSNVILGAVGMVILGQFRWPSGIVVWTLILLTTLCSAFDQHCITMALKLENTGAVAVIQALCVVLSFVFSILILSEPLYLTSALGGVFIFISVIVLGTAKMLQDGGGGSGGAGGAPFFNFLNLKLFLCKLHSRKSKKSHTFDIVKQHSVDVDYDDNRYSKYSISAATTKHLSNSARRQQNFVSVPGVAPSRDHYLHHSLLRNEPCLLRIVPICTDSILSLAPSVGPSPLNQSHSPLPPLIVPTQKSTNLQLSFESNNSKMLLQNSKKF